MSFRLLIVMWISLIACYCCWLLPASPPRHKQVHAWFKWRNNNFISAVKVGSLSIFAYGNTAQSYSNSLCDTFLCFQLFFIFQFRFEFLFVCFRGGKESSRSKKSDWLIGAYNFVSLSSASYLCLLHVIIIYDRIFPNRSSGISFHLSRAF